MQAHGKSAPREHHLGADRRLRGALRRLDVPDALEFDEPEYADAADWVFQAAQDIADESRWALVCTLRACGGAACVSAWNWQL